MRKLKSTLLALMLLLPVMLSAQVSFNVKTGINVKKWITSTFAKGAKPPFTFYYDGKPSSSFISSWKHSIKQVEGKKNTVNYDVTYTDPATGLKLTCHVIGFTDYQAVEWYFNIENTGSANSKQITGFKVADADFNNSTVNFRIHHNYGSTASKNDFTPMQTDLSKVKDSLYLRPYGGRSSDGNLPFFNIETTSPGSSQYNGVIAAIGWTGTWFADMSVQKARTLKFTTGHVFFDLWLKPGEKVRTERICFFFWKGNNEFAGNNQFRQFMLAHHSRQIDGKPAVYPITAGFNWGGFPQPCSEYECITSDWAVAVVKQTEFYGINPEVYWLDAGWYVGAREHNWYEAAGNWVCDTTRFPNGLAPIAQEVHKHGKKFLVWFEPERVYPNTKWRTEHPEWMLHNDGKRYATVAEDKDNAQTLIDLGNPEACEWVTNKICDFMEQNGIDYYRQDFNMAPEDIWKHSDEPGRLGIVEMKYVEGLYKYWDGILKRFPNALIDNCASGGRRIDLETMDRSAPLWRTDYSYGEPNGYQCHTYGLSLYVPQNGTGCSYTDPYSFRSSYSSAIQDAWRITDRGNNLDHMKWAMNEFYTIRPYFMKDYYPLTGVNNDITRDDVWMAYQLYDGDKADGYVVAFRRPDCKEDTKVVRLYGLDPEATYLLHNCDTRDRVKATGKELMSGDGFTLKLDQPRKSELIYYKKL